MNSLNHLVQGEAFAVKVGVHLLFQNGQVSLHVDKSPLHGCWVLKITAYSCWSSLQCSEFLSKLRDGLLELRETWGVGALRCDNYFVRVFAIRPAFWSFQHWKEVVRVSHDRILSLLLLLNFIQEFIGSRELPIDRNVEPILTYNTECFHHLIEIPEVGQGFWVSIIASKHHRNVEDVLLIWDLAVYGIDIWHDILSEEWV